jgi:MerR family transcriptional regulator/heat shock protein HspR
MNPESSPQPSGSPVFAEDSDTVYSLELVAELAGTETSAVLHYREIGLISTVPAQSPDPLLFDLECLRRLRRIEHLRSTCGVNDAGLKLILDLLHEVECLREERRRTR